jgi:XapX domain-containing protein
MNVIISLAVGIFIGAMFTLLKLPLPAPNALAGVVGIFGIYAGMILIGVIKKIL